MCVWVECLQLNFLSVVHRAVLVEQSCPSAELQACGWPSFVCVCCCWWWWPQENNLCRGHACGGTGIVRAGERLPKGNSPEWKNKPTSWELEGRLTLGGSSAPGQLRCSQDLRLKPVLSSEITLHQCCASGHYMGDTNSGYSLNMRLHPEGSCVK